MMDSNHPTRSRTRERAPGADPARHRSALRTCALVPCALVPWALEHRPRPTPHRSPGTTPRTRCACRATTRGGPHRAGAGAAPDRPRRTPASPWLERLPHRVSPPPTHTLGDKLRWDTGSRQGGR